MAVPFDIDQLKVAGEPVSVLEADGGWDISNSGTLVYIPQPPVAAGAATPTSSANTLVWVDKQGKEESLGAKPDAYQSLKISPDGRYVAYQSDESGKGDIFVRSFPDVAKGKWQVSSDGGNSPLWSPDEREIFYRNGDATMAVEVETEPTFKRGNPKILFRGTYFSATAQKIALTPWDIDPGGKKFLMVKPPAMAAAKPSSGESVTPAPQPKIIVVLNWFEELKKRVPVE